MTNQLILFLQNINVTLMFVCNIMIFLGGFYVAIHSRIMPTWAITGVWYLGLSSLLTSITIALDWILGPSFPLSYTNIGIIPDMLQYVILSTVVWILFSNTIYHDIKGRKNRHKVDKIKL